MSHSSPRFKGRGHEPHLSMTGDKSICRHIENHQRHADRMSLTVQDRVGIREEMGQELEARDQGWVSLCLHVLAKNLKKCENFPLEFGHPGH